ncbi:MAG TPA: MBL fold metallo-hydrolase, partial [Candidatus Nanopelagicales bacterium]|nr:MBL fold metallo-hydrolase [Candidatus Nanopelagicales bacterium]
ATPGARERAKLRALGRELRDAWVRRKAPPPAPAWHHARMDLTFLGAATTVTGSQFLLETAQARILVDCGMFQGGPNEAIRNRVPRGYDPKTLDAILLTHAHLDHCGLIPVIVREGFRGPIRATAGTIELARLVLMDSGRLQEEFAKRDARFERRKPEKAASEDARDHRRFEAAIEEAAAGAGGDAEAELRAQPAVIETDLDEPLYTEDAAVAALRHFRPIRYDVEEEVAPGIHATYLDAGHILGSAIIRLRIVDAPGGPERVVVFSGDLGKRNTPIIRDPTRVTDADYVLCESTYGGREHEPESEARRVLAEVVRLVAENDGVLLVPSFAIGRTQELIWALDRLVSAGEIPALPLYLDSPMAREATSIYRGHPEYYDDETRKILEAGDTPLDYAGQRIVKTVDESRAIARAPRPYMIVASNGMLTGGRVVGHLRELIDDPRAVILFVGYQGEGTLGRHLQDGATTVRLDGAIRQVRCQTRSVSGFSAHADEPGLLDWLAGFAAGKRAGAPGFPRRVFLVHGDPGPQAELAPKVTALGFDVHVPHWHETVTLD